MRPFVLSTTRTFLLAKHSWPSTLHRRAFSVESRTIHTTPHASHRAVYRWMIQGIATPFAVAYGLEALLSNRSNPEDPSSKVQKPAGKIFGDLPWPDTGALVEPIRMGGRAWGQAMARMGLSSERLENMRNWTWMDLATAVADNALVSSKRYAQVKEVLDGKI